jgi:hypothetical protein
VLGEQALVALLPHERLKFRRAIRIVLAVQRVRKKEVKGHFGRGTRVERNLRTQRNCLLIDGRSHRLVGEDRNNAVAGAIRVRLKAELCTLGRLVPRAGVGYAPRQAVLVALVCKAVMKCQAGRTERGIV